MIPLIITVTLVFLFVSENYKPLKEEKIKENSFITVQQLLPARMMYVGGEMDINSLIIFVLFITWLIVLFIDKVRFTLREGLAYLKHFWILLDVVIIIISSCSIIIYAVRIVSIGKLLDKIEKSETTHFVNYFDLFDMHMTLCIIFALLVCVSTIRFWKLVRFFKMCLMFEKAFRLVIGPVLALFLHHIIFVIAYTLITHIVLGENSDDFLNFRIAFQSLSRIYLGLFDHYKFFFDEGTHLEMAFIILYIIASKTFVAIYIVICVMGHQDVRELFGQYQEEAYSFTNYLKEEIMFLFTWLKIRKTQHHKEKSWRKQVVLPKPDHYLYANCISTTAHAMSAMTVVATSVLYNKVHADSKDGELSQKQIELMLRVCYYFLSEHGHQNHKEFFFKVHKGKTIKIIDGKRIDKEKQVVDMILGVSAKQERRHKLNRRLMLRHALREFDKLQRKLQMCLDTLENIDLVENNHH